MGIRLGANLNLACDLAYVACDLACVWRGLAAIRGVGRRAELAWHQVRVTRNFLARARHRRFRKFYGRVFRPHTHPCWWSPIQIRPPSSSCSTVQPRFCKGVCARFGTCMSNVRDIDQAHEPTGQHRAPARNPTLLAHGMIVMIAADIIRFRSPCARRRSSARRSRVYGCGAKMICLCRVAK